MTFELFCLVVQTIPYHLTIGHLSTSRMGALLDFHKDVFTFRHGDGVTKRPLVTEGMHKDILLSDEFTSSGESDGDGE